MLVAHVLISDKPRYKQQEQQPYLLQFKSQAQDRQYAEYAPEYQQAM